MIRILAERSDLSPTRPRAVGSRLAFDWHAWRKKSVASAFRRVFRRAGGGLCGPGQLPVHGIHRVLLCRPNHRLGNAVLLSPLIREIEALYPGAEIDILASNAAVELFANRFRVRKVFAVPNKAARHVLGTIGLLHEMRRSPYDLAIDTSLGSQSGRLALAWARARYKLGFPDDAAGHDSAWRGHLWPEHHAQRAVYLLRQAYAGAVTDPGFAPLDVGLTAQERADAAQVLSALCRKPGSRLQPVLGIFTNATGAKRLDEAWWSAFLAAFRVAVPEVRIVNLVAAHGCSQLGDGFVPFYTRNLRRLAALIAGTDAFISADCGVMHLAAASGTPTLGLFNVTDPARYAPYGGANAALVTSRRTPQQVAADAAAWFGALRPAALDLSRPLLHAGEVEAGFARAPEGGMDS